MGRILVVDDSNLIRTVLSRSLQAQGHEVETVANGRAALDTLRREEFDLVLLDVLMPGMDGREVLEEMVADPVLQHIPVIMISALDEMDSVIRCIELGAQDYLPKPADPLLLKARISASLAKKRLHDMEVSYRRQIEREKRRADDLLNVVIPIGVSLSGERDFGQLLERILREAMTFCHADGGSLYLRTDDDCLRVVAAQYGELAGGARVAEARLKEPPIPLQSGTGEAPAKSRARSGLWPLAPYVATTGEVVNIPDSYEETRFDFSAVHRMDKERGYRSISFLALPLRSREGKVIGVIQLVNARDPQTGVVTPFDTHLEQMMTSLSTLAAVALENYQREERLRREIEVLRIEIDEKRQARALAEVTDTDFFRALEAKKDMMRQRFRKPWAAGSLVDG